MEIRSEGTRKVDEETNKREAEKRILEDEVDVVLYTDGSAAEGRRDGGAAFVAKRKVNEEWKTCRAERMPAGKICSSFQAEMRALEAALK